MQNTHSHDNNDDNNNSRANWQEIKTNTISLFNTNL